MANTYSPILTKGTEASLVNFVEGKLRFTTDTGRIFLDTGSNSRIEYTDFVKGMTEAEIKALTTGILPKLYMSSDTSTLFYYDSTNTEWKTITSDRSGHIIEDADETALTQRDTLRFGGYLNAADDSEDEVSFISDAPTEITWDNYNNLTPAQKEGTKWLITNVPSAITDEVIFVLRNRNLTFSNLTASISDPRINSYTYPLVYWSDASKQEAKDCKITSNTSNNTITFTAETAPTNTLICDIVFVSDATGNSGGTGPFPFEPVSTEANQGLSEQQKTNARDNIGLGTSAVVDVPASGDASSTEVVLGSDSRLTDARNAADVYAWAKAETKPTYTKDEVGLSNVGNFKAVSTEASQGLTTEEQSNARANIGAGTSNFDGQYSSLTGTPTLGSAAAMNVATTGDAANNEVVKGDDTRLSDARPASDVSAWAKESTKPTYTATEVGAIASTEKGSNNGVATLDSAGKIPTSQLPSAIDEIIEGYLYNGVFYEDSEHTVPITGEVSKIYVDLSTNKTYRYSGSQYVEISASLALGETEATAYRGDRGKTAYDHSQIVTGNPHNVTKSDVGLGNVGNFKAVSTEDNQGLTNTEKVNARNNIGAGTSNFDGQYSSLTGTPTLGTAAALNVAASGNASASEVVKGNDTRLTDARPASDVSAWAKANDKPTYTASEVGLGNVGNFKAVSTVATVANQGLTSTEQAAARANIGLENAPNFKPVSTEANQGLTDTEKQNARNNIDLGSAAIRNVPSSGDASTAQVVLGNDSRLSDARNAADVYDWAKASTKPTYTKDEVGLGNVGNYKAVATTSNQGLTDIEKDNARTNIGAGTSNFDGQYSSLTGTPTLGTAAALNVAASGDAATNEVVKGDDARLTDARPASDVYNWAKAETKPSYTATEVGLGNVGNFKAVSTEASQGLTSTEQENARTNMGLGTGAVANVASSGDASATEIVLGSDSRLTNARPASDVYSWAKSENKPTYTATEVGAIASTEKGANNGVATLDAAGKIPSSQLPGSVDEIVEGYYYNNNFYEDAEHTIPITGETSKIYVDLVSNKTYRYSGTAYVEISASLALGETEATAYRGDRGKTAYDHSQITSGNPHNVTANDVGLGNVGNFKAVSTVASQGLTSTEQANARTNIGLKDPVLNQTLTFVNNVATVSITGVTADTLARIYYHDIDAAKAAKITSETGSGVITFTARVTPTSTIIVDIAFDN